MHIVSKGLLSVAAFFAICGCAQAQSITTKTFNVKGTILPGVCYIDVDDVDLGTYQSSQFTGTTTTGFKKVDIKVTNCDPLIKRVGLHFTGVADGHDATLFKGVDGIGVELQRVSSGARLRPGGWTQMATAAGTHQFQARFAQSNKVVAAGTVSSPVTVSMTYD